MFHQIILLANLAILKNVVSLPLGEKIEPVDLAFRCLELQKLEENAKSPIVLIHGLGGSQKNWNGVDTLLAMSTKRRVCAVDLRNHGNSPWNNRSDVEALAVDIGHFLDKMGMKKVNLIGHSLGGKVAMHFTLKNPDRVDSIVVEDIRPNTITPEAFLEVSTLFKLLKATIVAIPEGLTEDEAKKSIVNLMNKQLEQMGTTHRMPEQMAQFIEIKLVDGKWQFKHNMEILEESLKNPAASLTESSGLYEGPVLFIYGTKSPFKVNEDKENILKLFPKARLFPIEGAGHIIHGLFPEFNDAVIRFLNEIN